MTGFGDRQVVKIATHPDGRHYLALTSDGEVFSWGNGDGGRLGHGDSMYVLYKKKKVIDINDIIDVFSFNASDWKRFSQMWIAIF